MDQISFKNKVAIVTGAGAGIGREYALDLAGRGAKVVVNDIGKDKEGSLLADHVVQKIISSGGHAVSSCESVSSMKGGQKIVSRAVDHFGKVDILINNAGILRDRTFLKMTENEWDDVISVHLKGAFCVTQPALKIMKENGYGRIVFTTSTSGMYGTFGQSNYGAAKMGIIGIMNTLKLEMARYNIKINAVAPNASTQMTVGVFPKEVEEKIKPKFNTPMVTWLCSEENMDSGLIFTMSAGWFATSAMVSGKGVCIGDTIRDITAEEIKDQIETIKKLDKAQPFENAGSIYQLGKPLTGR